MKLEEISKEFLSRMVQFHLVYRAIKKSSKKEVEELISYVENLEKLPLDLQDQNVSSHNFSFYSAKDGAIRFYGQKEISIEEQYSFILIHKNKQYQWLLAEAYEVFEDLIENLYAYIGCKNYNLWLLGDYGNISFEELKSKDYNWFQLKSKNKKKVPHSILQRFRELFPKLLEIEKNNKFNIHLKLALVLIENLRHIIVHRNGVVENKDDFITKTLEKAGLFNNGNPKDEHRNFISQYFGVDEYENYIRLLEMTECPYPGYAFEINRSVFESLTNYLLAYADILIQIISEDDRINY